MNTIKIQIQKNEEHYEIYEEHNLEEELICDLDEITKLRMENQPIREQV